MKLASTIVALFVVSISTVNAQCQSVNWESKSGTLTDISVGADNTIWGVDADALIYRWNGPFNSGDCTWSDPVPGYMSQISVGDENNVWGVDDYGNIFYRNEDNTAWVQTNGALSQISAASDGTVWGVSSAGNIYYRNEDNTAWVQVNGALQMVSVGKAGVVWGVSSNGNVYYRNAINTAWVQVSGSLKWVDVSSTGEVWGVNENDAIYYFVPETGSWKQVCGYLKQVESDGDYVVGVDAYGSTFISKKIDLFGTPTMMNKMISVMSKPVVQWTSAALVTVLIALLLAQVYPSCYQHNGYEKIVDMEEMNV